MERLKQIFLQSPDNRKFWLALSFLVKGILFALLLLKANQTPKDGYYFEGFWGPGAPPDIATYFEPIENLVDHGSYTPDHRMPGYGAIYMPLYLLFPKATAFNILILLQYLLAALSVYYLALAARYLFRSEVMFYLTFYMYLLSTYSNLFDANLMPESFTISFLVFAVYFFARWTREYRSYQLLIAGLCITEAVFLRAVYAPVVLLLVLLVVLHLYRQQFPGIWKPVIIFLFPFLLIDGLWVARNYKEYGKVIPLQASPYYEGVTESFLFPLQKFIQSWGGEFLYWDPKAEIRWFGVRERKGSIATKFDEIAVIPDEIYTSRFNYDSLLRIKEMVSIIYTDTSLSPEVFHEYDQYIKDRLTAYTQSIKEEKPLLYYIKAPLRLTKKFLFHSGTYNLFSKPFSDLSVPQILIKVFYSLYYMLSIVLATIALFLLIKQSLLFYPVALVSGIFVFTAFVHPALLRFTEYRYFVGAWPFVMVCASYTILWVLQKYKPSIDIKKGV